MATSYNTDLTYVVKSYLQRIKARVTDSTIVRQLEQNPFFPSLYSINNTLDKFKIPNEAFIVESDQLDQLEPPFITYCKNAVSGKDFVLVTAITATDISYISNSKKEIKTSKENFLKDWERIVFVAEPNSESGESKYEEKFKREQINKKRTQGLWLAALTIFAITITGAFINIESSLVFFTGYISLTKLLGTGITVLLLVYELDKSNSFVKSLCSAGKQTNCDAVLRSKASGIAGIKWSEAGFFYFASSSLFLFFPSLAIPYKIPFLAIGATAVAPYILFSIYYQYKIVKQWCPLCLAVQAVLLLELIWAVITYWANPALPAFTASTGIAVFTSLLLPLTIWFMVKPLLYKAKGFVQFESAYKRLLYNPSYFNQLLQQQQAVPDGWQQLGINIGNPNATNTIIKVCNPYCPPCAKAHPELEAIIHNNKEFNLKVIFTATNNEKDKGGKPVKHLLAIAANNNPMQIQQALDDWYNADKKDYDAFAAKYPMNGELKKQYDKVQAMDNWCREAGISATPSIFINGKPLPQDYNLNELKNIL